LAVYNLVIIAAVIMIGKASEKVAGGKLVRLELEHDGSKIIRAKITGDFFMHPEDALSDIEALLVGMQVGSAEADISARISKLLSSKNVEVVGFSAETVAKLVKTAAGGSK